MKILKKIYAFLISMKFAIALLVLVAVFCMLGSFIPQRNALPIVVESEADVIAYYSKLYGERSGTLIYSLHLDDVFHCWWFIVLVALLCLSVLLCNLSRVRSLIRKTRDAARIEHALSEAPTAAASGIPDPKPVFRRLRFFRPVETTVDGRDVVFACRNRLGFWGAWVCHLGIVLIVLGYALGQMTLFTETVYGVVGDTLPIGDTGYSLEIGDFTIERTADGFIKQYASSLTMHDANGNAQNGTASVNHPAVLLGYKVYQVATGQVADVTIFENGQSLGTVTMPVERIILTQEDRTRIFSMGEYNTNGLYHLYCFDLNNEHVPEEDRYIMPGERIGLIPEMIVSEPVDTQLRVKKDSFAWLVLVGAVLTTLGLFFALYVVPETVWAVKDSDGTWAVNGKSRKLATLFTEQFDRAVSGRKGKEAGK